jgi:hypothetical protein
MLLRDVLCYQTHLCSNPKDYNTVILVGFVRLSVVLWRVHLLVYKSVYFEDSQTI